MADVTFNMKDNSINIHQANTEPWSVTLVDTGEHTMTGGRLKRVFDYIKEHLPFDQLIWEFGTDTNPDWVHVSFDSEGKQRKQVLKAVKKGSITTYVPYK